MINALIVVWTMWKISGIAVQIELKIKSLKNMLVNLETD
jgi:hypothetical protein